MEARKYCVYNRARESTLSSGVTVIDTTLEPLKLLKVMIEGLAKNTETGLWLNPLNEIPRVPRLAPFDLVYLDKEQRVLQGAELLPGIEFPAFEDRAESALVLPFKTMSSSHTCSGDQLAIEAAEEDGRKSGSAGIGAASTALVDESAQEREAMSSPDDLAAAPPPETEAPKSPAAKPQPAMSAAASLLEKSEALQVAQAAIRRAERVSKPLGPAVPPRTSRFRGPREKLSVVEAQTPAEMSESELGAGEKVADRAAQRALERAARQTAAEKPSETFFDKNAAKKSEPRPPVREDLEGAMQPSVEWSAVKSAETLGRSEEAMLKDEDPAEAAATPGSAQKPEVTVRPKAQPKRPVTVGKHVDIAPKPIEEDDEKVPVVTRVLRWLYPNLAPPVNSRHAIRRPSPDLMAYRWVDGELHPLEIGDISSSGVYLKTEERWQPGERISLILQRKGPPEESPERQFLIEAGAARWGDDGVGLAFILPPGMDVHIWEGPAKRRDDEKEPEYILREFRMARALGFVRRICPAAVEEVDLLFHRELSNYRLSSAVEIALNAEMMLVDHPEADQLSALPDIVVRILELGSWAEGDLLHQMWAGLLATSCTVDGNDTSNSLFIDLLTPLTMTHARILQAACTKATKVTSSRGEITSYPLYFTADEIMKIAGTNDLSKIHRAVALMGDFGLFEKSAKSSFISATEKSKTTPTSLGLQLCARCNGHRDVAF